MCYRNYCTLFVSSLKRTDNKVFLLYENLLSSLLQISTVNSIKSVFLDAQSLKKPTFFKGVLSFIKNYHITGDSEITVAVSSNYKDSFLLLNDFKRYGINRICIHSLCISPLLKKQDIFLLKSIKQTSNFIDRVCVDVIFDKHENLNYSNCFHYFRNLLDVGVTHITLQQSTSNSQFNLNEQFHLKSFEQYSLICEVLMNLGFCHYALCYFALPGYVSFHYNSLWKGKSFVGIGPNAHSRISLQKEKFPNRFAITCLYKNSKFQLLKTKLTKLEILEELLYLGLRSANGIDNDDWKIFSDDKSLYKVFGKENAFSKLLDENILTFTENNIRMNMNKILLLDSVLIILFQILYKQFQ